MSEQTLDIRHLDFTANVKCLMSEQTFRIRHSSFGHYAFGMEPSRKGGGELSSRLSSLMAAVPALPPPPIPPVWPRFRASPPLPIPPRMAAVSGVTTHPYSEIFFLPFTTLSWAPALRVLIHAYDRDNAYADVDPEGISQRLFFSNFTLQMFTK